MVKLFRDMSDPFRLPENNFRKLFRLSPQVALNLFLTIREHFPENPVPCGL
jgi:hypothetical protein